MWCYLWMIWIIDSILSCVYCPRQCTLCTQHPKKWLSIYFRLEQHSINSAWHGKKRNFCAAAVAFALNEKIHYFNCVAFVSSCVAIIFIAISMLQCWTHVARKKSESHIVGFQKTLARLKRKLLKRMCNACCNSIALICQTNFAPNFIINLQPVGLGIDTQNLIKLHSSKSSCQQAIMYINSLIE